MDNKIKQEEAALPCVVIIAPLCDKVASLCNDFPTL